MNETTPSPLGNVITIDDERIKSHLDRVVRAAWRSWMPRRIGFAMHSVTSAPKLVAIPGGPL